MQMKTGVEQAVYALLMLMFLPERAVLPGEVMSTQLGASPTYFQKILRKLVQADLIVSVPGKNGGFKMKRDASELTVYDVYLAIEGKQTLYTSTGVFHDLLGIEEKEIDTLSRVMGEAESLWMSTLQQQTIRALMDEIEERCPAESLERLKQSIESKMVKK